MEIDTRILQLHLLNMMKEFHRICVENDLTYYIVGGTCLGAVRHRGFIPWDDDVDISMPRKSYDTFCKISQNVLPKHLELRYYKNTKNSPFHMVKLVDNETTLIERFYQNYLEGVYIDIFPLDAVSQVNFFNKCRMKLVWFLHAMMMNHFYTRKNRSFAKRCFERFSKITNINVVNWLAENLMKLESCKEKADYICSFLGAYGMRECVPADYYGVPKLYCFEGASFYGPEKTEEFLTHYYGDYMKLPPKENQVCKHDYFYVDLNMPFREYLKNKS